MMPLHVQPPLLTWNDKVPFAAKALALQKIVNGGNTGKRLKETPIRRCIPDTSLRNMVDLGHFPLIRSKVPDMLLLNKLDELAQSPLESVSHSLVPRVSTSRFTDPVEMQPVIL